MGSGLRRFGGGESDWDVLERGESCNAGSVGSLFNKVVMCGKRDNGEARVVVVSGGLVSGEKQGLMGSAGGACGAGGCLF